MTLDYHISVVAVSFLFAGYFMTWHRHEKRYGEKDSSKNLLTNRERLILAHLTEGKINKEIANSLNVELSTVKTHINNLYSRLKVKSRKEIRAKFENSSASKLD